MISSNQITVFEHQALRVGKGISQKQLESLQAFYGEQGTPYFSLIHRGVKFNSYVGVIQVGNTTIEVLPKADRNGHSDAQTWRELLIGMMQAVGTLKVSAPSSSALRLQPNSILDLYFALFIQEIEYLLKRGLIKQYSKREGNLTALKGRLLFQKQLSQNIIHKERFYVNYTNYDNEHLIHQTLYQAILLVSQLNNNPLLSSKLGNLILNFPEMPPLKITEKTFAKIPHSRKTTPYEQALAIARLLLLNYHPDLQQGRQDVLALMFDMNILWEKFVYLSLAKYLASSSIRVSEQRSRNFWEGQRTTTMRSDILIEKLPKGSKFVLDTKWKNFNGSNPSIDYLRQMYVYLHYFEAKKAALVYPNNKSKVMKGYYYSVSENLQKSNQECSMVAISVGGNIHSWQKEIAEYIMDWIAD